MLELAMQYFLFILLASLGVLQIAASYGNLRGLSFFKRPILGYIFGAIMVAGGFTFFYLVANPNPVYPEVVYALRFSDFFEFGWSNPYPELWLIMGEVESIAFFILAVLCAILVTIVVSSIVKSKMAPLTDFTEENPEGVEKLRGMTFFQAITRLMRERR